jgi:hypothetical protein
LSPLSPSGSDPEINASVTPAPSGAVGSSPAASAASAASATSGSSGSDRDRDFAGAFRTGELVEVFTDSVRALARIRESSDAGRLHIAFEMGEYLPWVDAAVLIRHAHAHVHAPQAGSDVQSTVSRPATIATARILHAGTSTALLQLLRAVDEVPDANGAREPYDTVPLLGD